MRTFKILTLLALLVVVSAFGVNAVKITETSGYTIGDEASDFYLRNVDGEMVSLKDFKSAKGFILIFTCNTCPFSIANEDRIIALDKKYKSKGYPVIAINPNNPISKPGDSYKSMQLRAQEKGFTFPYLFDDGQKVYPKYGATKTPHVYILEKNNTGNPIVKYIGAIDDNSRNEDLVEEKFVENAVNALLEGKDIKVTETKAIGCSIKA
ncbi:thioredoxin family protein [Dokdonia sp. Hel_I_53]|uniref:thioredoxin family protein n=1 Tax=Dokdonia sp. Hel_I_53 TaxID=1566287 RepID=UPI00119C74BD|nr:thioredoxin family protein [Dokdonia sp. Hel_I_53]TVZ51894.1 AhpC/TSA family protein [Dokdonia sp. Hel_I_53]